MSFSLLHLVGFILGLLLVTLAASMLIPMLTLTLFQRYDGFGAFLWSSLLTAAAGLALVLPGRSAHVHFRARHTYLLTTASWVVVCAFAALPMVMARHISYTDTLFETMSGITTTGSTVFSGLDQMSSGILAWHSLLHWLSGVGFIGMAVAILPLLRVGGMRLFQTESSDWGGKVMPRSHMAAKYILGVYVALTLLDVLCFWWTGMTPFEALNHSMATISTGGFSASDASPTHWPQPVVHWVAVLFMILGSLPFILYVATLRGHRLALPKDHQVRGFTGFLAVTWPAFAFWLWLNSGYDWWDALHLVAVNVTSVVITTGFTLTDYTTWGTFAVMPFFYLTFVGGCSGFTADGLEIFCFQVAFVLLRIDLQNLAHPRATTRQGYNGHPLDEEIVRSLITSSFFLTTTTGVIALGLTMLGLDWVSAFIGATTAVCNVGLGLGPIIGPAGNFPSLPDMAKWLLTFGMLLGRLKILTVLVLCTRAF